MVHKNLTKVGGVQYNEAELTFANTIAKTLGQENADQETAAAIAPYKTTAKAGGFYRCRGCFFYSSYGRFWNSYLGSWHCCTLLASGSRWWNKYWQ